MVIYLFHCKVSILSQKDSENKGSKCVNWNYCIQTLLLSSQHSYLWTIICWMGCIKSKMIYTIQLEFAALINLPYFKSHKFSKAVLWFFKIWYWDHNLLSRWHKNSIKNYGRQKLWKLKPGHVKPSILMCISMQIAKDINKEHFYKSFG